MLDARNARTVTTRVALPVEPLTGSLPPRSTAARRAGAAEWRGVRAGAAGAPAVVLAALVAGRRRAGVLGARDVAAALLDGAATVVTTADVAGVSGMTGAAAGWVARAADVLVRTDAGRDVDELAGALGRAGRLVRGTVDVTGNCAGMLVTGRVSATPRSAARWCGRPGSACAMPTTSTAHPPTRVTAEVVARIRPTVMGPVCQM